MSRTIPLSFIALTAFLGQLEAQDSPPAAPANLTPYLIAISVANLDSSIAWYRTLLGFRVSHAPYEPVRGLRIAFLIRGDFRLELLQAANSRPRRLALPDSSRDISLQGFTKLGFKVPNITAAADRFRQRGVPFVFGPALDTAFHERHFIVADPDGNLVQLFQPMPQ